MAVADPSDEVYRTFGMPQTLKPGLMLTGNVALESMGFKTFGFAGGREGSLGTGLGHR